MVATMNAPGRALRATTVSPGPIDTPLLHQTHGTLERAERGIAKLEALVPLGRLGLAEEVADAVSFVFSPAGACLGGELLSVGGGITMQ
jgi:3-oxoacyl-[acyl-carrier protein] reductase